MATMPKRPRAEYEEEAKLQAMFKIAIAISSNIAVEQIMEMGCRAIVELCNGDHSAIVLLETDRLKGVVRSEYGDGIKALGSVISIENSPAEDELFRQGEPIIALDVSRKDDLGPVRDILLRQNIQAIAIVPIQANDRIFGSISLDILGHPCDFSERTLKICKEVAAMLAIPLERERLVSQLKAHQFRTSSIKEVLADISSKRNINDLLVAIVNDAAALLQSRDAGIYLYDPSKGKLRLSYVLKSPELRLSKLLSPGEGMAGKLFESGEDYMTTTNYRLWPGRAAEFDNASCEAVLQVPVRDGETVRGIIFVESAAGRRYTEDEISVLQWLADHSAIAIGNAELLQQGLLNLIRSFDLGLDIGLSAVAETLVKSFDASLCRIILLDDSGNNLQPRVQAIRKGGQVFFAPIENPRSSSLSGWAGLANLLKAGKPRFLRSREADTRRVLEHLAQWLEISNPINNLLIIPLMSHGRILGLIDLIDLPAQYEALAQSSRDFLRTVTDPAALALERHLDDRLRNNLVRVSEHVSFPKERPRLLQESVRLATELFPGTIGVMFGLDFGRGMLHPIFNQGIPADHSVASLPPDDPVAGTAAHTARPVAITSTQEWPAGAAMFGDIKEGAIVAVPIEASGTVEAVLVLCHPTGYWLRPDAGQGDLEALQIFAKRISTALTTASMISPDPRLVEKLTRLYPVNDYMLKAPDLKKMLHAFLTGVTAAYGLGLNRAVVFLVDPRGQYLEGKMAIGDAAFWRAHKPGFDNFQYFVSELETGKSAASPFDKAICELRIPLKQGADILSNTFFRRTWNRLEVEEFHRLPSELREVFQPTTEVIVGPLHASHSLGVIVVDNQFSSAPITELELTVLMSFSHRAAAAIQNRLTFADLISIQERLQNLYEASANMVISESFVDVAKDSTNGLLKALDATAVLTLLMDDLGHVKDWFSAGEVSVSHPQQLIREDGMYMDVFRTRTPRVVQDPSRNGKGHLQLSGKEGGAFICFPIVSPDRSIGLFHVVYKSPHVISGQEEKALMLFGKQAGIAFDAALKFEASRSLVDLSHYRPSDENDYKKLMESVLEAAAANFNALAVSLLPYDRPRDSFEQQNLVTWGLPPDAFAAFRDHEPQPNQVTFTALDRGYIEVPHVSGSSEEFLSPETRALVAKAGITAFQAVRLEADGQVLGVLYVSYAHARQFERIDRIHLTTFAARVSQLLRNARVHLEMLKAKHAAQALAEMTALRGHDPAEIFKFISEQAHALLQCDIISLYTFDETADRIANYILGGTGADGRRKIIPSDGWIHRLITERKQLEIDYVDKHKFYGSKPFAIQEGIKTFRAVPLQASGRMVGLMFVNYCKPHRFTPEERRSIDMVANQVSVAIRNAQLFEEGRSFAEFGRKLLGCRSIQEIAQAAVDQAAQMLGSEFSDVVLVDSEANKSYKAMAYSGWPAEIGQWRMAAGRGSHTGYTIEQRQPIAVPDFSQETRFVPHEGIKAFGIVSGLSACLYQDRTPIGALLVHSKRQRQFGSPEEELLQRIATETAAAMQGHRLFEAEAKLRAQEAQAILDALKAINQQSRGLDPDRIFSQILQQAVHLAQGKALVASLHRYDAENHNLILDAVYPSSEREPVLDHIGVGWSLVRGCGTSGRIGVVGRAVLEREAKLVDDVDESPDYVRINDKTQSELAVPLFDGEEPVGAINLESATTNAFNSEHKRLITALGHMVVIVMRNVRDYEELKETITRLDARNALAWITTTKNYWGHALVNATVAVRNNLVLLREDLKAHFNDSIPEIIENELREIEKLVQFAESKPVTPPLSSEEGLMPVYINHLLTEKGRDLAANHKDIEFELGLHAADTTRVLVSEEWLTRAVDLIVENAIRELRKAEVPEDRKRMAISTRSARRGGMEIVFRDHALGIPNHIRERLFVKVIKGKEGQGLGIGMLMARTIVETYGGKIRIEKTGNDGTEIVMWFPQSECTSQTE